MTKADVTFSHVGAEVLRKRLTDGNSSPVDVTFGHLGAEHVVEDRAVGCQHCSVHTNLAAMHHQSGICEQLLLQHVLACMAQASAAVLSGLPPQLTQ